MENLTIELDSDDIQILRSKQRIKLKEVKIDGLSVAVSRELNDEEKKEFDVTLKQLKDLNLKMDDIIKNKKLHKRRRLMKYYFKIFNIFSIGFVSGCLFLTMYLGVL